MSFEYSYEHLRVPESHMPVAYHGSSKDSVKLIVVNRNGGTISSGGFLSLPDYLNEGDLLVVNNSGIVKASFSAYYPRLGKYGYINFGTSRKGDMVLAEPRPKELNRHIQSNEEVHLIGPDVNARLVVKHDVFQRFWWVDPGLDEIGLRSAMKMYGKPITYGHVAFPVSEEEYTTEFSKIPGSVEPPSAGLPFTEGLLDEIRSKGVGIAELTLHCNLGSLEPFEFGNKDRLLDEKYSIPNSTLRKILETKNRGGKVIAVGTTVVRALESYALENGSDFMGNNHLDHSTDIFIKRGFEFKVVDGLITGMHDYTSSHIDMISALVGPEIIQIAYGLAIQREFMWHEFGDMTLIL